MKKQIAILIVGISGLLVFVLWVYIQCDQNSAIRSQLVFNGFPFAEIKSEEVDDWPRIAKDWWGIEYRYSVYSNGKCIGYIDRMSALSTSPRSPVDSIRAYHYAVIFEKFGWFLALIILGLYQILYLLLIKKRIKSESKDVGD